MEGPNDLITIARNETGLSDLGGESFREGLEVLVGSLNREGKLNEAGERALRERILGHLKQRLQVEDWYARHPEIAEVELLPVLFGVSLPRTGSTVLSFLLASDPGVRYLRAWESNAPCPPPSTVSGPDPRRGELGELQRVSKKSHTPTGVDGPMECLDLMALDFRSQMFQAFAAIPTYADWLMNTDMEATYLYHRRVLKLLQWGETRKPWRLKTPAHLLYLPDLDKVYPDARFVMTHRDPTDVILSVATVYTSIASNFSDDLDPRTMGALNVKLWSEAIERAMAFRAAGNDARFYDIHFRAMHEDPIGQVRGLYAWLGEEVSPEFEAAMASWWAENNARREPAPKPNPASFGVDLDEVRGLFADYRRRMEQWTGRVGTAAP